MVVLAGFEIYVLQSAGGKPFQGSVKEGGADASSTYGRIDQDIAEYPEMLTAVLGVFKDTEAGESSIRLDGLENRHILGIDMLHNICMPERTAFRHHGRDIFLPVKCKLAYAHLYLAVGDVSSVGLKVGIEHLHQYIGIIHSCRYYIKVCIHHLQIFLDFIYELLRSLGNYQQECENGHSEDNSNHHSGEAARLEAEI